MEDFQFEFPSLTNEQIKLIENWCFYWVKTFQNPNTFTKKERKLKYRQKVESDIKKELDFNEEIENFMNITLDREELRRI